MFPETRVGNYKHKMKYVHIIKIGFMVSVISSIVVRKILQFG